MTEQGHVLAVTQERLGDDLLAAASAGATSLTVDFGELDELGGMASLNGQILTYTSVDDDTGVVTLTTPLDADADAGDRVFAWDASRQTIVTDLVAQVQVDGDIDGDPHECSVEFKLVKDLSGGIRGLIGESVLIEEEDDDWRVIDVLGLSDPNGAGSGAKWEADDTYTLTAADITAGTATFPLTYQPIVESLMAVLGIPQPPTEYSIDYPGQTITWPLDGWEEAGDVIWVHYEYMLGFRNLLTVPMGAVWKYATGLGSSTTYAQPAFNDSAWSEGPTPFGRGSYWSGFSPNTGPLGALSNVWLRMRVATGGGALTFTPSVDDELWIYLDGTLVAHKTISDQTPVTAACSPGNHLVAVYGLDTATPDMTIAVTVSEAP